MTRISIDIQTGKLYNHHQVDGDALHVLTMSTCILLITIEILDNADGTTRPTTIGNATIVSGITEEINLDTCLFLGSADLQNLGNYLTTSAKSHRRQPHQRQHHQRRKLQSRLQRLRVLELRDRVSEPTQLQVPAATT